MGHFCTGNGLLCGAVLHCININNICNKLVLINILVWFFYLEILFYLNLRVYILKEYQKFAVLSS